MNVLLVAYDLNKPGQDYRLLQALRKLGDSRSVSESAYVLETSLKPTVVRDQLSQFIDDNDKLFVMTVKGPLAASGSGAEETFHWLEARI